MWGFGKTFAVGLGERSIVSVFIRMVIVFAAGAVVAGCGAESDASTIEYPSRDVEIVAPADPGGGYDQTAREAQQALAENNIVGESVEVYNNSGAGGALALIETVNDHRGDPHHLMIVGASLVGALKTTDVPFDLSDTTPIANLAAEYGAVAVPADSEYETLDELMDDYKDDPGAIAWGGGSALGGIDHQPIALLSDAAGVEASEASYVAYDGSGELIPALLAGDIDAAASGAPEFLELQRQGEVRILAVAAPERIEDFDAPTMKEEGYDVTVVNWRGLVAPPDITGEQRDDIIADIEEMHGTPEWQQTLEANNWDDTFATGEEFTEYVAEEDRRTTRLLENLGVIE